MRFTNTMITSSVFIVVALIYHPQSQAVDFTGRANMNDLTIRLADMPNAKESSEIVVRVIFRNVGKTAITIPLLEGDDQLLFFDFLLLSDKGQRLLTNHADGWADPLERSVRLIDLLPGKEHVVTLTDIIRHDAVDRHNEEQFYIVGFYHDHSARWDVERLAIRKSDPSLCGGVAVSGLHKITMPRRIVTSKELAAMKRLLIDGEGLRGDESKVVQSLIDALKRGNPGVRRESAEVLGLMGPKAIAASPALVEALKEDDPGIRTAAEQALRRVDPVAAKKAGLD